MYTVNGKNVDLSIALPLKLGDFEDLEEKGLSQKDMEHMSFKQVRIFVQHVLQRANKEVTTEDVRALSMVDLKDLQEKIQQANSSQEKVNFPT